VRGKKGLVERETMVEGIEKEKVDYWVVEMENM
jgi:hypothetical protein